MMDQRRYWPDLILVVLVAATVVIIRTQGWRGIRLNNADMLPYYEGARTLLRTGDVLDRGDISSYGSYSPPGTVYLMVPGVLFTDDARLQRVPGDSLVFIGMLVLLYLAIRALLGRGVALAATVLTSISSVGYLGIYPIGHPVFVLGTLAGLILWVRDGRRWGLPVALVSLAAGLYADLGILPYAVVVVAAWFVFRPRVWWPGAAAAILVAVLLWLPYLGFEAGRGFADVASILTLRRISAERVSRDPCLAALPGESEVSNGVFLPYIDPTAAKDRLIQPAGAFENATLYRTCTVLANLDSNFDTAEFLPGTSQPIGMLLLVVTWCGQTALLVGTLRAWRRDPARNKMTASPIQSWVVVLLTLLGAVGAYAALDPEGPIAYLAADDSLSLPARLVVSQLRLYLPMFLVSGVTGAWLGWNRPQPRPVGLLAMSVWIPYLILIVLAEPGRVERLRWLWPLQAAILVYAASMILPRRLFALRVAALAMGLILILPLPILAPKLQSWNRDGYSGTDAGETVVVDILAERSGGPGVRQLRVGYDAGGRPAEQTTTDVYHRTGAWIDYLLETRHGIQNTRDPGRTLTELDDFRIRDTSIGGDGRSMSLPGVRTWEEFHLIATVGPLEVYQRARFEK